MLSIRYDLPRLSGFTIDDAPIGDEDVAYRKDLLILVRRNATQKQLGIKFDHFVTIVDRSGQPVALEFVFLGENHHGTERTVSALMRDLVSEVRAKRGLPPIARQHDFFGEL